MRVLALYPRRDAATSVRFLRDHLLKEFPFPIQRIQTDRGGEFSRPAEAGGGMDFQVALMQERIRFRPIRPYSPHSAATGGRNGKVERSQRTDRMEFYATADLKAPDLAMQLKEWQQFYNEVRPHGGIGGRPPLAQYRRAADRVPARSAVAEAYDPSQESNLRVRDYAIDKGLWPPS